MFRQFHYGITERTIKYIVWCLSEFNRNYVSDMMGMCTLCVCRK